MAPHFFLSKGTNVAHRGRNDPANPGYAKTLKNLSEQVLSCLANDAAQSEIRMLLWMHSRVRRID
jgi:hypothetical protein